jgi:hypothetical protein
MNVPPQLLRSGRTEPTGSARRSERPKLRALRLPDGEYLLEVPIETLRARAAAKKGSGRR